MKHRTTSAYILSLILSLGLSLQGSTEPQSTSQQEALLTIGGKSIDKDELIYLISKGQGPSETVSSGIAREEFDENLDLFINYKLKVREAEAQGLDQTEEFMREFESFKENLRAPFLIKNSLEEGELRKAYSRMQEVIRASHILIQFPPTPSKEDSLIVLKMALKVKNEVENGGNFNQLALEYSDDPSAKQNKGDLGYFTALQMVQPFEDAAYNMKPGEVSNPVLTNFGYHIIAVQDRQPNPGQVQVSHILVRIDPNNPNGEDLAKRKVNDIYIEIQKESTTWEDIVRDYSEDPSSREKGGLLPWFSVGSMIPEFEMAAFMLTEPGEVSPPIRTQYGYHILRLEEKKPLESFESLEDNIKSRILRDSRSTMIKSQVMAIQKSRYNFEENETNVSNLRSKLNELSKSEFRNYIETNGETSKDLFKIGNKSQTASDLLDFLDQEELAIKTNQKSFDFWYDRFVAKSLNEAEEKDLLTNNKDYQMLLKEYRDGILLFSLMNKEVWQKGIEDSVSQKAYFQRNIEKYQWPNRVNAYIVKVLDLSKSEKAKELLANKTLSPELVTSFESYFGENSPLAYQTESGLIPYETDPVLSKANLDIPYQEIEANGHLHLILLGAKIPAGPKEFEETRGLVIRDFQESLEKELVAELRKKYPVQINSKAREEAFISLNQ
ncbi:MAG: peptidylprolyl isomerase [Algoriphagus sp.]|uniref:peptidylprolyl isomerase n=1 Tax=Algoriphagus sp. TaxID=1872435 RepID=UPI002628CD92|nr:peptidylprolyl isomerase [Algoriphagus sp.]MDG1278071.1 peptidylprolyl isomerase [Algoriphagus sp.]